MVLHKGVSEPKILDQKIWQKSLGPLAIEAKWGFYKLSSHAIMCDYQ